MKIINLFNIFLVLFVFTGCIPVKTNTFNANLNSEKNKVIYNIEYTVPSYCYDIIINKVQKDSKNKTIYIDASISSVAEVCAQTVNTVKKQEEIAITSKNYDKIILNLKERKGNIKILKVNLK